MLGFTKSVSAARNDHNACSGCSLCLLVCPVWRETRDLRLTPHGRAKALQHDAGIADISASVESCTLCAACEPVCPERIDLVGMIVNLRRQLPRTAALQKVQDRIHRASAAPGAQRLASDNVLLLGAALRTRPETLTRVETLLGSPAHVDDGADIALGLETGAAVSAQRLEQFLAPLRRAKRIVVAEGLLLRHLYNWLPQSKIVSLGEALSGIAAVRDHLHSTDLYVIEPRAYHADYQRLVKHYDRLRATIGCATNLDLQRIAIPATARNLPQRLGLAAADDTAHARWILHGRKITRIVVESAEDIAAFESLAINSGSPRPPGEGPGVRDNAMPHGSANLGTCPVVHLADVVDDAKMPARAHA